MSRVRKQYVREGRQSHYMFKNFIYDKEGRRLQARPVTPFKKENPHLISTAYLNPTKNTKTVYCLMWDLDADRALDEWKKEDGSLDWGKMGDKLVSVHPELIKYITLVLKSTGGKGLHLMLAMTPIEIIDSTESCQRLARAVQAQVFRLLDHYGMGVDRGALGLERDFVNWHNENNIIDGSVETLKFVQSDKNRPAVLNELVSYLNSLPMCSAYKPKKGDETYLYPDLRSETKFALLYHALHTQYFEHDNKSVEMTSKEIMQLTGLSYPTIKKVFTTGLHWLEVEYLGYSEGWLLTLKLDAGMTKRAAMILEKEISDLGQSNEISLAEPLKKPEEVADGERNEWITKLCLILKHAGISQSRALVILKHHITRVEGHFSSRNCRSADKILNNIYFNKPNLFNLKGSISPDNEWLLESEIKLQKGRSPIEVFLVA